jgi:hypothetical protein
MNLFRWLLVIPMAGFGLLVGLVLNFIFIFTVAIFVPDLIAQLIGSGIQAYCFVFAGLIVTTEKKIASAVVLSFIFITLYSFILSVDAHPSGLNYVGAGMEYVALHVGVSILALVYLVFRTARSVKK